MTSTAEAKRATLLTEEEERHSWMFSLFDQNDDKEISYVELKLYMEFLGEYPTTAELKVDWCTCVALLFSHRIRVHVASVHVVAGDDRRLCRS